MRLRCDETEARAPRAWAPVGVLTAARERVGRAGWDQAEALRRAPGTRAGRGKEGRDGRDKNEKRPGYAPGLTLGPIGSYKWCP